MSIMKSIDRSVGGSRVESLYDLFFELARVRKMSRWKVIFATIVVLLVITGTYLLLSFMTPSVDGFGIYLLESGELVISDLEIVSYNKTSHEIKLTDAGVEKIEGLQMPLNGAGFVIKVEGEEIYCGAFWSPISSLPYHGVVIEILVINNSVKIDAGYPSSQFQGEDPRDNPKVFDYLEKVGKLID